MKKLLATAAGVLLIAGQTTVAMAGTSDAVAASNQNARLVPASYCTVPAARQMKMNAHTRAHLANRCNGSELGLGGAGTTGLLFGAALLGLIVVTAVATNNAASNKGPVSP